MFRSRCTLCFCHSPGATIQSRWAHQQKHRVLQKKTRREKCQPNVAYRYALRKGGHTFPFNDRPRLKAWIVAIHRGEAYNSQPSKHSVVCRAHFSEDDYTTLDIRRYVSTYLTSFPVNLFVCTIGSDHFLIWVGAGRLLLSRLFFSVDVNKGAGFFFTHHLKPDFFKQGIESHIFFFNSQKPKPTATATAIMQCGRPVSQPLIIDMFHSMSKSKASRPHYMYIIFRLFHVPVGNICEQMTMRWPIGNDKLKTMQYLGLYHIVYVLYT